MTTSRFFKTIAFLKKAVTILYSKGDNRYQLTFLQAKDMYLRICCRPAAMVGRIGSKWFLINT